MIKSFSPIEFELYFQYQNEDPRLIWGKKRFWNTNTSPQSINWLRLVFTASKYPIDWTRIADLVFKSTCFTLSMRLDCVYRKASCICPFFFFFFFLSNQFSRDYALFSRSCTLRSILRLHFFFFFEKSIFTWLCIVQWVPCIIHGTHKYFIPKKKKKKL